MYWLQMLPNDKLNLILRRHEEIEARLAAGAGGAEFSGLSRELSELGPVVDAIRNWRMAQTDLAGVEAMLADKAIDADLHALAEEEKAGADVAIAALEQQIRIALLPKDSADEGSAILEVRAGTGGDEAALFAGDLFRMYQRYAEARRWSVDIISASEGTAGGYKEIIAEVNGRGVFARLKFESGVHRVQRVPATESQGRIHTSTVTVAVLPEAEEVDVEVNESDLRIDVYRASGAGGQHVNKTDSAIRITHIPTGIIVACQTDRSQHRNRANAMEMLRARMYEAELRKREAVTAAQEDAKTDIGWGHQIRNYVLAPYQLVKDLRTGVEKGNPDAVLDGDLDEFMAAALAARSGATRSEASAQAR